MEATEYMTVGELAKAMQISVRTLQYYDKEGLLKPSAKSEGGRRRYTKKDMVMLHQILALKSLGFSLDGIKSQILRLDDPAEVAEILKKQQKAMLVQAEKMNALAGMIGTLREEVLKINEVDFYKYASIISLLEENNDFFWVWKLFSDDLREHVEQRFANQPDQAQDILQTYREVLDDAIELKRSGKSPESGEGIKLGGKWWGMILEFTGGDMSLIPKLMEFNENKEDWNSDVAEKQKEVDDFIGEALTAYLKEKGEEFEWM